MWARSETERFLIVFIIIIIIWVVSDIYQEGNLLLLLSAEERVTFSLFSGIFKIVSQNIHTSHTLIQDLLRRLRKPLKVIVKQIMDKKRAQKKKGNPSRSVHGREPPPN